MIHLIQVTNPKRFLPDISRPNLNRHLIVIALIGAAEQKLFLSCACALRQLHGSKMFSLFKDVSLLSMILWRIVYRIY